MARRNIIIIFAITVLISQLLLLFVAFHTDFGCTLSGLCATPGKSMNMVLADLSKVEIFYETHCPDSQDMFKNGLRKSLDLIDETNIELIPYGKAETFGEGSSLHFRCQHGQKECDGNTYHACAINMYGNKRKVFDFVICTMSNHQNVLDTIEECANKNNIDYAALRDCFSSVKGRELLAEMGKRTEDGAKIINKGDQLDFVPSTIIDGIPRVFESYQDLRGSICTYAKHKPSKC